MAKTVYEIITERFMEQLKQGIIPWEKPWVSIKGERCGAWRHESGKPYSLLNQMILPEPGEYITFKQCSQEGGRIKKGAKGSIVTFWTDYKVTEKDANNVDVEKRVPVLKYYTVFHIKDTEGITAKYQPDTSELDSLKEPQRCKRADELIQSYVARSGINLRHEAQNQAYYSPIYDEVVLPLKKQFTKKAEYYSTAFHELVHSTGHRDRLNRLGTAQSHRGKEYSLEELVAEMGAAAILFNMRLETKSSIDNNNAYLQSWYQALSNDSRMIVKASARAQKAVRYIYGEEVKPNTDWKKTSDEAYKNVVDTDTIPE